jgi:hypothetical protein
LTIESAALRNGVIASVHAWKTLYKDTGIALEMRKLPIGASSCNDLVH